MVYLFVIHPLAGSSDKTESKRIHYIDLLKFFASILVILSHCLIKYVANFDSTPLFNLIWLTQMPLFIFLAGVCEASAKKLVSFNQLFTRFVKHFFVLVFPCFTFMILKWAMFNLSLLDQFIDFYNNPESNLWFLWVLFLIHVIFELGIFVGNKVNKKWSIAIPFIVSAAVCLVIFILMFTTEFDFSILGFRLLAYYLIFFCFGYLFKLILNSRVLRFKSIQIIIWLVSAIALITLLFEMFYFRSIYSFSDTNILQVLVRMIGSVSSIIVFMVFGNLICSFRFIRKISYFGRFSLESYFIHILVLSFLTYSVVNQSLVIQYLTAFGSTLLLVAAISIILLIMYFVPYSHLIIFGKSWSFYKFEQKLPTLFR